MAGDTLVKRAILQIAAQDGDTEATIDKIKAKAKELGALHPEIKARIDAAAVSAEVAVIRRELKDLSKPVDVPVKPKLDTTAGGGFPMMGTLITAGVVAALAGLPAILAAGGAAAGIALGTALLVGTQQVQGPLYQQFHTMMDTLRGILRTSALPLVQPLAQAFHQVGIWAQGIKPDLTAVFGSLGPMVAPLTRGLEGLVQGVLPGFLRLMQAARPAMQAFAGLLTQTGRGIGGLLGQLTAGVGPASKFMSGLGSAVTGLLPVVGQLANVLAGALAPVMQGLGGSLVPGFAASLKNILVPMTPLLNSLGQLIGAGLQLTGTVLPGMTGQVNSLTGAFNGLASIVGKVAGGVSWLSSHLGSIQDMLSQVLGHPNSGIPGFEGVDINGNNSGGFGDFFGGIASAFSGLGNLGSLDWYQSQVPAGFGDWAAGMSGFSGGGGSSGPSVAQQTAANQLGQKIAAQLGAGLGTAMVRETIPVARARARELMAAIRKELAAGAITASQAASLTNTVQRDLQAHIATVKRDAAKLGESLTVSLADSIASSTSAGSMKTAVGKLLADVKTAYDDGILTLKQDRALTTWLDGEAIVLEGIASKRAHIVSEISSARQLAASTASSVSGGYGLSNFASTGPNGEPMNVATIIRTLRGDVIQARQFGTNIKKLAREGLPKSYLMQLIQMGPVQGGPLAAELAAAALGDIKTISTYENQISEASGSIGKIAANIQFEGGKAASKGFLLELEKQKQALDKAGQRIAQALVKELRKDLGPGGAAATSKVEIRIVGGDKAFREWLKKSIRITGGQVQVVGA